MPRRCSVPGCPNRRRKEMPGIDIKYHLFPKSNVMKQKWIKAIKRRKINVDSSFLCSIHFRDRDYERDLKAELMGCKPRRLLKKDVVPSLNLPQRVGLPQIKLRNICAIITCPNHYADLGKNLSFFKLPEDKHVRKKWIDLCKLESDIITDTSKICSEHFLDNDYMRVKTEKSNFASGRVRALRKDAIPSLKLPENLEPPSKKIKFGRDSANALKSLELNLSISSEMGPQIEESESLVQDCSNPSTGLSDCDPPTESSLELKGDIFFNCETQEQFKTAIDKLLSETKNKTQDANAESKQSCSNCSDMLMHSIAAEVQLAFANKKILQAQKQILQLEKDNKRLKEQLDEKDTSKLQEEMEKIFNGVLSKSQMECLMNRAQKSKLIREDGALKLKPIGTYRLYNIPRETHNIECQNLTLRTDRTAD